IFNSPVTPPRHPPVPPRQPRRGRCTKKSGSVPYSKAHFFLYRLFGANNTRRLYGQNGFKLVPPFLSIGWRTTASSFSHRARTRNGGLETAVPASMRRARAGNRI